MSHPEKTKRHWKAGRKKLPWECRTARVPIPLLAEVARMTREFKAETLAAARKNQTP